VVHPNANIIFGADIRDTLNDEVLVTVIATGFKAPVPAPVVAPPSSPVVEQKPLTAAEELERRLRGERAPLRDNGLDVFGGGNPAPAPQQPVAPQRAQEPAPQRPAEPYAPRPASSGIPGTRVRPDDDFPEFLKRLNNR